VERTDTTGLIISSLRDVLSEQDENAEIPVADFNESTYLIGPRSFLDSLTLVSVIVDIEQKVNDEYGVSISIADERAMSQEKSPFRTIGALAEYVQLLIKEQKQDA
jgi:acyl carrier protein